MLVIPAIDLKNGECVRLRQGDMDQASVFSTTPVEMAAKWVELGARRLHLVDLDGAFAGQPKNLGVIQEIVEKFKDVPVQVGGGIRSLETIQQYMDIGVQRVILGTIALREPEFVKKACEAFPGKVMVGIDAKDGFVAVEGWAEVSTMSAVSLAKKFEDIGVEAIIYTDIAKDGMMQGVNLDSTKELAKAVSIPIIASGGVSKIDDIKALCELDAELFGVITGRAIYEGALDFAEAQALSDTYLEAK
ncbi:MAG TPA: 1-(5-phosphoribosyl)-5-((5-phosphoribosylamino)methylideneamino)imidazole-4-carboxamide isomerase [Gammaproteobacteria bacterium]|nr:1-(5-phosphoribosyl)-5-((5-phosphoribosylamino)methylideneamino)imidazole-4-carboxamide isomerase [Gammaproteobacteria bacterium]HCK93041.1 1-(5-phosphoribosyl)-5-((5-phosphoribosylamino)methylideneamino)imidazole-4-carboxamide isomerase [Gammaproteobacteria bacterium]|tara:strand:- start:101 stop:841 length:741 start_codon:yes stop_codon:yes gene_type:complete